jgi:hypothetical protein
MTVAIFAILSLKNGIYQFLFTKYLKRNFKSQKYSI